MLISVPFMFSSVFAATPPTLSVEPGVIADSAKAPSSTFIINVTITNILNLYGYEFKVGYDTTVLTGLNIQLGSFFPPNAIIWANTTDDVAGFVWFSATMPFGSPSGISGNGTLAIITFSVDSYGLSRLLLYDDLLGDPYAQLIYHELSHGYFANAPVASFTFTPSEPIKDENILFNASASTSMSPTGTIVDYKWNFGDGNTTSVAVPTIVHAYNASGDYGVTLTVTDSDGLQDSITKRVLLFSPGIYVTPTSGPIGTKVTVKGYGLPPNVGGDLFFDDQLQTYYIRTDQTGRFNASFNVPLSAPGLHVIKVFNLYVWGEYNWTTFTVIDMTILDINVDVGELHFRGELAEFFIQTAFKGIPTNATTITATLYKPDDSSQLLTTSRIAAGLYKATYTIPLDSPVGTYTMVVQASLVNTADYIESKGTSLKSFLLSDKLTGWLVQMSGDIATIETDIGTIKVNMSNIDTKIVAIEGDVVTIQTDIGTIQTDVNTIKTILQQWTGTVSSIITPKGTYNLLILTNSTALGPVTVSDYSISIPVTGTFGTSGKTNIIIPKQLLSDIEATISKIAITIDNKETGFTYTEQGNVYILSIGYTHSTRTIKVFLTGIPPSFPWTWIAIGLIIAAAVAVLGLMYRSRKRKALVASTPKPNL